MKKFVSIISILLLSLIILQLAACNLITPSALGSWKPYKVAYDNTYHSVENWNTLHPDANVTTISIDLYSNGEAKLFTTLNAGTESFTITLDADWTQDGLKITLVAEMLVTIELHRESNFLTQKFTLPDNTTATIYYKKSI